MTDDLDSFEALDARLRTLLPEEYQDSYEAMKPTPMGSAGLKYGPDGRVAWDEIWGSFCDLAMAGGPPHKGALLEAGTRVELGADPERYERVVEEICRGVVLTTGLAAEAAPIPGWVRVECLGEGMAGWLLRAIVMENISARAEGISLDLPASPAFRLEREIKNVVTVIAKTNHYWEGHMPRSQRRAIGQLFETMAETSPLIQPAVPLDGSGAVRDQALFDEITETIIRETGCAASSHAYAAWLGVECATVPAAVWMMRALVASNVLSRREGTVTFLPVNAARDPHGATVARIFARVHRIAAARGVQIR
jgi:sirohydrochlorin cobaltochelatase